MNTQDTTLLERARDEALMSLGRAHLEYEKLLEANRLLQSQHEATLAKLTELTEQSCYGLKFLTDQLLNSLRTGRIPLPTPTATVKGIPVISLSPDGDFTDGEKIVIPVLFEWPDYQTTIQFAFQPGLYDTPSKYPDYQGIFWKKPDMAKLRKRVTVSTK